MPKKLLRWKKSLKQNVKEASRNIDITGYGKVIRLTNLGANDIYVEFGNYNVVVTKTDAVIPKDRPSELFVIPDGASHMAFACLEEGSSVSSTSSQSSESSESTGSISSSSGSSMSLSSHSDSSSSTSSESV